MSPLMLVVSPFMLVVSPRMLVASPLMLVELVETPLRGYPTALTAAA